MKRFKSAFFYILVGQTVHFSVYSQFIKAMEVKMRVNCKV